MQIDYFLIFGLLILFIFKKNIEISKSFFSKVLLLFKYCLYKLCKTLGIQIGLLSSYDRLSKFTNQDLFKYILCLLKSTPSLEIINYCEMIIYSFLCLWWYYFKGIVSNRNHRLYICIIFEKSNLIPIYFHYQKRVIHDFELL